MKKYHDLKNEITNETIIYDEILFVNIKTKLYEKLISTQNLINERNITKGKVLNKTNNMFKWLDEHRTINKFLRDLIKLTDNDLIYLFNILKGKYAEEILYEHRKEYWTKNSNEKDKRWDLRIWKPGDLNTDYIDVKCHINADIANFKDLANKESLKVLWFYPIEFNTNIYKTFYNTEWFIYKLNEKEYALILKQDFKINKLKSIYGDNWKEFYDKLK